MQGFRERVRASENVPDGRSDCADGCRESSRERTKCSLERNGKGAGEDHSGQEKERIDEGEETGNGRENQCEDGEGSG